MSRPRLFPRLEFLKRQSRIVVGVGSFELPGQRGHVSAFGITDVLSQCEETILVCVASFEKGLGAASSTFAPFFLSRLGWGWSLRTLRQLAVEIMIEISAARAGEG